MSHPEFPNTFDSIPDEVIELILLRGDLQVIRTFQKVSKRYKPIAEAIYNNNQYWNQYLKFPVPDDAAPGTAFITFQQPNLRTEEGLFFDKKGREYFANYRLNTADYRHHHLSTLSMFEPLKCAFINGEVSITELGDRSNFQFLVLKMQLEASARLKGLEETFYLAWHPKLGCASFSSQQLDTLLALLKNNTNILDPNNLLSLTGNGPKEKLLRHYFARNLQYHTKNKPKELFLDWLALFILAPIEFIYTACKYGAMVLPGFIPLFILINKLGTTRPYRIPEIEATQYPPFVRIEHGTRELNPFNLIIGLPWVYLWNHIGKLVGVIAAITYSLIALPFVLIGAGIHIAIRAIQLAFKNYQQQKIIAHLENDVTAIQQLEEQERQAKVASQVPPAYSSTMQLQPPANPGVRLAETPAEAEQENPEDVVVDPGIPAPNDDAIIAPRQGVAP